MRENQVHSHHPNFYSNKSIGHNADIGYQGRDVVERHAEGVAPLAYDAFTWLRGSSPVLSQTIFEAILSVCEARADADFALSVRDVMRASHDIPSYAAFSSLIGAFGNAQKLEEMDRVLDDMLACKHIVQMDVITKMIYHHGWNHDIEGMYIEREREWEERGLGARFRK